MSATTIVLSIACAVLLLLALQQRGARRQAQEESAALAARLEATERRASELEARLDRAARERPAQERALRAALIEPLLSVDDHVQRALAHVHDSQDLDALRQGVELLARDLDAVWRRVGVERVEASVGTAFDPAVHEAIARLEAGPEADSTPRIAQLAADGFCYEGQVLRPARVAVAVPVRQAPPAEVVAEVVARGASSPTDPD